MQDTFFAIIMVFFGIAIYFLPTIIAASQKKKNTSAILALNIFLGWTIIGWVISLVWAFTYEEKVNNKK